LNCVEEQIYKVWGKWHTYILYIHTLKYILVQGGILSAGTYQLEFISWNLSAGTYQHAYTYVHCVHITCI